ncbi:Hypothetical histidine triad (HIT) protein [Mycobacteroides abscessus]|nr:Hypothetical histidine triad (HIT) protein [Mycobacteroides abscessus]
MRSWTSTRDQTDIFWWSRSGTAGICSNIPADDLASVAVTAQRIAKAVVTELGADGVNLLNCCGAHAWQTEFHFHLHVIPRYADKSKDGLRLPWIPGVPGDTRKVADLGNRLAATLA